MQCLGQYLFLTSNYGFSKKILLKFKHPVTENVIGSFILDLILSIVFYIYRYIINYLTQKKKKLLPKKRQNTNIFISPLALIMARISCCIISISFHNVTRFISIQRRINFSVLVSCIDDGRVGPLHKAFSPTVNNMLDIS